MPRFVALLRGINVGGNNLLPMQVFRGQLERLGCENVSTYIQSGNAVFRYRSSTNDLADRIAASVREEFGFEPKVLLVSAKDYLQIVSANPYVREMTEQKFLHVWFTQDAVVNADLPRLKSLVSDGEQFSLQDKAFFLHAPNGIGRSKLGANVEKCLGVAATARNWRSVLKIADLLADLN